MNQDLRKTRPAFPPRISLFFVSPVNVYRGMLFWFALVLSPTLLALTGPLFTTSMVGGNLTITSTIPGKSFTRAGIRLDTPGFSFTNGCQAMSSGYCIVSVSKTTPATVGIAGPSGAFKVTLASNGYAPINRIQTTITGNRFLYVASIGGTIYVCPLNTADGSIGGSCYITVGNGSHITLNPQKTYAYLSDPTSNQVSVCSINQGTGALTFCTLAGSVTDPQGMAFNTSATIAYVINGGSGASTIYVCPINTQNGTFSACSNTGTIPNILTFSTGIVLNPENTVAYISNGGGAGNPATQYAAACQIDPLLTDASAVINCSQQQGFGSGGQLGVNMTANGSRLYFDFGYNDFSTGQVPGVYLCGIKSESITHCILTGGSPTPSADQGTLVFNDSETIVYGARTSTPPVGIEICSVDAQGLLYGCNLSPWSASLVTPQSLAIY